MWLEVRSNKDDWRNENLNSYSGWINHQIINKFLFITDPEIQIPLEDADNLAFDNTVSYHISNT